MDNVIVSRKESNEINTNEYSDVINKCKCRLEEGLQINE